jgi:hypothetical protein
MSAAMPSRSSGWSPTERTRKPTFRCGKNVGALDTFHRQSSRGWSNRFSSPLPRHESVSAPVGFFGCAGATPHYAARRLPVQVLELRRRDLSKTPRLAISLFNQRSCAEAFPIKAGDKPAKWLGTNAAAGRLGVYYLHLARRNPDSV